MSLMRRQYGSLAQLGEHLPYKQRVIGSSPIVSTTLRCFTKCCTSAKAGCTVFRRELICCTSAKPNVPHFSFAEMLGPVVQLVRTLACHARGRRFEPDPGRQPNADLAHPVERHLAKVEVASSSLVIRSIIWCHSQVVRRGTATP